MFPGGLLGCAGRGMLILLLGGPAATGGVLAEVSPRLVQERWERPCSSCLQLGSVESERVMEELVLLARLDHPASARERQGLLTPRRTPQPWLPAPRAQMFLLHPPLLVRLKQAPEMSKEYLDSEALLGCSKCRLATDLAIIFTSTSP